MKTGYLTYLFLLRYPRRYIFYFREYTKLFSEHGYGHEHYCRSFLRLGIIARTHQSNKTKAGNFYQSLVQSINEGSLKNLLMPGKSHPVEPFSKRKDAQFFASHCIGWFSDDHVWWHNEEGGWLNTF